MTVESVVVPISGDQSVTALRQASASPVSDWLLIYAPGAGSNVNDPFGAHLGRRLADEGVSTVRFQFPYMEAGKRRPDRPAVLEDTWSLVIEKVRGAERLVVGGRSMGGRIGSQVVAKGGVADAVALFTYPLRPPANPERVRDAHLPDIPVPTLFCSGTRDAFGTPEELERAVGKVPEGRLHLLEGADHGFAVPKSSGRTRREVWDEATDVFIGWLRSL